MGDNTKKFVQRIDRFTNQQVQALKQFPSSKFMNHVNLKILKNQLNKKSGLKKLMMKLLKESYGS